MQKIKKDAEQEVTKLVAQYGGENGMLAALQQSGITSVDAYRQTLYLNKLMTEAVKKAAELSRRRHQNTTMRGNHKSTVQHILTAAKTDASDEEKQHKTKAEELIQQLKDWLTFSELAKSKL